MTDSGSHQGKSASAWKGRGLVDETSYKPYDMPQFISTWLLGLKTYEKLAVGGMITLTVPEDVKGWGPMLQYMLGYTNILFYPGASPNTKNVLHAWQVVRETGRTKRVGVVALIRYKEVKAGDVWDDTKREVVLTPAMTWRHARVLVYYMGSGLEAMKPVRDKTLPGVKPSPKFQVIGIIQTGDLMKAILKVVEEFTEGVVTKTAGQLMRLAVPPDALKHHQSKKMSAAVQEATSSGVPIRMVTRGTTGVHGNVLRGGTDTAGTEEFAKSVTAAIEKGFADLGDVMVANKTKLEDLQDRVSRNAERGEETHSLLAQVATFVKKIDTQFNIQAIDTETYRQKQHAFDAAKSSDTKTYRRLQMATEQANLINSTFTMQTLPQASWHANTFIRNGGTVQSLLAVANPQGAAEMEQAEKEGKVAAAEAAIAREQERIGRGNSSLQLTILQDYRNLVRSVGQRNHMDHLQMYQNQGSEWSTSRNWQSHGGRPSRADSFQSPRRNAVNHSAQQHRTCTPNKRRAGEGIDGKPAVFQNSGSPQVSTSPQASGNSHRSSSSLDARGQGYISQNMNYSASESGGQTQRHSYGQSASGVGGNNLGQSMSGAMPQPESESNRRQEEHSAMPVAGNVADMHSSPPFGIPGWRATEQRTGMR